MTACTCVQTGVCACMVVPSPCVLGVSPELARARGDDTREEDTHEAETDSFERLDEGALALSTPWAIFCGASASIAAAGARQGAPALSNTVSATLCWITPPLCPVLTRPTPPPARALPSGRCGRSPPTVAFSCLSVRVGLPKPSPVSLRILDEEEEGLDAGEHSRR